MSFTSDGWSLLVLSIRPLIIILLNISFKTTVFPTVTIFTLFMFCVIFEVMLNVTVHESNISHIGSLKKEKRGETYYNKDITQE